MLGTAARVVALVDEAGELLDHDPAGDVATGVPAHAVGDDEDGRRDEEGVLVDLAHVTDVGGGSVVQIDRLHALPSRSSTMSPGVGSASSVEGMSRTQPAAPPRTLADQLRGWPDERLAGAAHGPSRSRHSCTSRFRPAGLAGSHSFSSVIRALDGLTRLELSVLDALVVAGQTTSDELISIVHAEASAAGTPPSNRLVDLALVWESPGGLRPLSGVADALRGDERRRGQRPAADVAGPGGPQPTSPRASRRCRPPRRALLEHVDAHGGEGTTGNARRTVSPADAATPVEELIAHRLLLPRDGGTARPAGRGGARAAGRAHHDRARDEVARARHDRARPGARRAHRRRRGLRRRTPRGAAARPLGPRAARPSLRSGGLAVRDLKATARDLQVDEPEAGLLVEIASTAGLLTEGVDPRTATGVAADRRLRRLVRGLDGRALGALVLAWLDTTRVASLIGARDPAGKTWNALAPDLSSEMAPEARRLALEELAAAAGRRGAGHRHRGPLAGRSGWRGCRPRRPAVHRDLVAAAVHRGRRRSASSVPAALPASRSGRRSPATTTPPSRPSPRTCPSRSTTCCSRPTSPPWRPARWRPSWPGPCTSWPTSSPAAVRPSTASPRGSVRRAFDAGWSALEVHDFVGSVSRTPVPQPLTYLVDDVARTFGTVRVGQAESFLRADDEVALTELVHDPKRRVPRPAAHRADGADQHHPPSTCSSRACGSSAPPPSSRPPTGPCGSRAATCCGPAPAAAGDQPVQSTHAGTAQVSRPWSPRSERRPRPGRPTRLVRCRDDHPVRCAGRAARGDRVRQHRRDRLRRQPRRLGRTAWSTRVRLEGGRLTAHDHRADDVRAFAVHRITAVRLPDHAPTRSVE